MSAFCGFIVAVSLILALPCSIILLIILLFKHKSIKPAIVLIAWSVLSVIIFTLLGTATYVKSKEYKESIISSQQENGAVDIAVSEGDSLSEQNTESSISTLESDETLNEPSYSIEDEEYFKNSCTEITYNDLDESWIGKWVTKEILFNSSEKEEYECGSTEDFIEEMNGYQRTYRAYKIYDQRIDKSFPIQSNDVIRIYGIVTDIKYNWGNGLNYPIIDMYYADYIREWRKPADTTKSIEELISERNAEKERLEAENEYYASLNSDYIGQTKNVDNMETLSEDEFKEKCDSMNFKNMVDSTEDLSGRYVKLHIQLTSHKVFAFEEGKQERLGALADLYDINDNVWYSRLYYERTEKYIGEPILLYFVNNDTYNLDKLERSQELTVYGKILDYEVNDGYHNELKEFLVVYIE